MTHSRRYTVVFQQDVMSMLERLAAEDIAITLDLESFERDLSFSPQTAGILKASGYYIGRRGAVEIKYHVSDDDRMVRIIGVRRCAHPFDVVLSGEVQGWLHSVHGSVEGDLALDAIASWTPHLRRDPRLLGRRIENDQYRDVIGRVTLIFSINESNCRVTILSINVE